jgi:hypothetical protein
MRSTSKSLIMGVSALGVVVATASVADARTPFVVTGAKSHSMAIVSKFYTP